MLCWEVEFVMHFTEYAMEVRSSEQWCIHLSWRYRVYNGDYYSYFELDDSGNEINKLVFSWSDDNENLMCDEEDQFMFDGESCTKEEWFARTRKYLFTDEEGKEQIRNQAEWTVYCE